MELDGLDSAPPGNVVHGMVFTVHMNIIFMKHIKAGQISMMRIRFDKVDRRKAYSRSELIDLCDCSDEGNRECVYPRNEWLSIVNCRMLNDHC